jgi:hypothetical protein
MPAMSAAVRREFSYAYIETLLMATARPRAFGISGSVLIRGTEDDR